MTDLRNELAKTLFSSKESDHWGDDASEIIGACERVADALILAGYSKPRVVTTVAELEALPRLSVVQTPGRIWQKLGGSPAYYEWQAADGGFARNSENFLDCNQHLTILMQTKGTL